MTRPGRRRALVMAAMLAAIGTLLIGWARTGEHRGRVTDRVRLTRTFALRPTERVFAYSRISPDGATLAYSSEMPDTSLAGAITRTVRLVNLKSGSILFEEPGIDPYWSPSGDRIIYLSLAGDEPTVTVRSFPGGKATRDVAPPELGDYYSWGSRDGRDLIVTVKNNYYDLDSTSHARTFGRVATCPGFGTGERPLVSKDGRRVTSFIHGNVAVRPIHDCEQVIDTGLPGAKADFSWDGRYIAFHLAKGTAAGYEIQIVDLEARTVRTLTGLSGSSLFPSWTRDGRLSFRYDGPDYRGFITVEDPLNLDPAPLPRSAVSLGQRWPDVFPGTSVPAAPIVVVTVWAPWSAHTVEAFASLRRAQAFFARDKRIVLLAGPDPESAPGEVTRMLAKYGEPVPPIHLSKAGLIRTSARNQMPTTLLFKSGVLTAQRLGAVPFEELRAWIEAAAKGQPH